MFVFGLGVFWMLLQWVPFYFFFGGFFVWGLGFFCVCVWWFLLFLNLDMSRIKWNIQNEDKTSVWILV